MAQPTQKRLADQLEKPEQVAGNVGHAGSGIGPENAPHDQDHEDDHVHHVAMPTYYAVFALLMVLLFITVGAWYIDQHYYPLGTFSTPIAMAIAVAKAVAIVLIFMHVKFASRLVQIFACTGVAFVTIMFLLTFQDFATRDWLPRPGVAPVGIVPHIRAYAEGAAPNDQSTPADNMTGTTPAMTGMSDMNGMTPGVGTTSAIGSTTTIGSTANTGVIGANVSVSPNAEQTRPGAILGGAANNSFGSEAQSRGIEPSRSGQVQANTRTAPRSTTNVSPAPATR